METLLYSLSSEDYMLFLNHLPILIDLDLYFVQEHTAHFILRLLSPPVPVENAIENSHLIDYAPILNVLFVGIASVDCVQIFSLHGLVSLFQSLVISVMK